MTLSSLLIVHPSSVLFALITACVIIAVFRSRAASIDHIPGPFISKYTDALRAYMAYKYSGREENLFMNLHRKYGDVVRVGPRSVSVLDPRAVSTLYGVKARLNKGPNVLPFNVPGVPTSILAILDETTHARYRRPIQHTYSLTSLKGYEPYVDDMINQLVDVLDRHAQEGTIINISTWLYYWSYDTIGKLTFGQPTGYMEAKRDFNNLIKRQQQFFEYVNVVSQMPALDGLLAKNPLWKLFPHKTFDFVRFAQIRVNERLATYDPTDSSRPDLLSNFIAARESYPEVVDDEQVLIYSLTNVIAGSLSTSHVLDEIVRFLTANPEAQHRIADEIMNAAGEEKPPFSLDLARKSPYLDGVINEGYRIHSVANISLEREVSSEGMKLPSGHYLPPGTLVGINAAAMNRRQDIFGEKPEIFDPLRWMQQAKESQDEFVERRLRMDRATLTFGQGSRSCVGKNIVQLEVFKVIATVFSRFTFEAVGSPQLYKVLAKVKRAELCA